METSVSSNQGPGLRVTTTATTGGYWARTSSASSPSSPSAGSGSTESGSTGASDSSPGGAATGSSGGSSALMKDDSVPSSSRRPWTRRRLDEGHGGVGGTGRPV